MKDEISRCFFIKSLLEYIYTVRSFVVEGKVVSTVLELFDCYDDQKQLGDA